MLFFIIFCRYYHGEQIYLHELDRSSGIHYKDINAYKILVQKLEKMDLAEMVISKLILKWRCIRTWKDAL
jgi:hypothetical protein